MADSPRTFVLIYLPCSFSSAILPLTDVVSMAAGAAEQEQNTRIFCAVMCLKP